MSAQKSQQAYLSVSTAQASAKTITGITKADPAVVSATSHGYTNGDIILIDDVVGMTQVNNRAYVKYDTTSPLATGTFQLKGVDTSITDDDGTAVYSTYASGGSAYKQTMTEVGQIKSFSLVDGSDTPIDVSNLRSVGKEYLTGLPEYGSAQFGLWLPNTTDTGVRKLWTLRDAQKQAVFTMTLSSGLVMPFVGRVTSFSITGAVDGAVEATCTIKHVSKPADFA